MKLNVAHFLRKHSQLKASFINNQIGSHIKFTPVLIYKILSTKTISGFAEINNIVCPKLDLSENIKLSGKLKFKLFKLISTQDVRDIQTFISKNNINILHFHYGSDAGIYAPFLKTNKIPSIVSFYGYDCSGFQNYYGGLGKKFLQNRVFPYVTKVLAMSPDMKNDLIKIGCPEEKIIIHYYGTDVKGFCINRNYERTDNLIRFLIISGLTPQKGHIFLLKSFKAAHEKKNNIRLTIVGDGEVYQDIKNFIDSNQMSNYVEFHRSVVYKSETHLNYLKEHDIFIHPSITDKNGDKEGIPGAIIEAMVSGLPIISTYHAGIPFIIEHYKSGYLVKEWDFDGLERAIIELASDRMLQKKIGIAGQQYALDQLTLQKGEEELERIYSQLI